jgi:hypothetical protein
MAAPFPHDPASHTPWGDQHGGLAFEAATMTRPVSTGRHPKVKENPSRGQALNQHKRFWETPLSGGFLVLSDQK